MSQPTQRFIERVRARAGDASTTTAEGLDSHVERVIEAPTVATPTVVDTFGLGGLELNTRPTPAELAGARTGLTGASLGVANHGSIVLPSGAEATELVSLYPRRHVAILAASAIVEGLGETVDHLADTLGSSTTSAVMATGPSATADMGDLVYGAHGPTEVHVVVVTDR
ncbi:MAG: LUD domain-containing protein [Halobacteriota archaeon]